MSQITSTRPYLVRAIYDWIEDNKLTPYILVNAMAPDVSVPQQYVKDGRIVLNISSMAVRHLQLENEQVKFSARFGGVAQEIYVPKSSVLPLDDGGGSNLLRNGRWLTIALADFGLAESLVRFADIGRARLIAHFDFDDLSDLDLRAGRRARGKREGECDAHRDRSNGTERGLTCAAIRFAFHKARSP